jgi:phosphotriesterase-related protein
VADCKDWIGRQTRSEKLRENDMAMHRGTEQTRREALGLLGAGVAAAALPGVAHAAEPTFPKGAIIRTLFKDYAPAELAGGATLFHEHMSLRNGFMTDWMRYSAETRTANRAPNAPPPPARPAAPAAAPGAAPPPNFLEDVDLMSDEMKIAKSEGIACIVDAGHPDMGRDINFLRKISKNSGLPIVASAGFYSQPFYPKELSNWSEAQVVDAIMKQINADPIGALGEIGSWDYISRDERKVFRAVGKVQAATGLPVFTHTGIPGKSALEQLDLLEDAGADPKKIVIGHLGNLNDPNTEIQRAVIRRGAFIGLDRQGGANDDPVAQMAMSLIEAGYADHLMFSADIAQPREIKRNNKETGGYAKAFTVFAPKVKKLGATDEVIHQIMVDNPRRFLAFVPKTKRKA